jgi:hypothetical protein
MAKALLKVSVLFLLAFGATASARASDLDGLENLQVPRGNKLTAVAYAEGVQIYRWNGTAWAFVAPEAALFDWTGAMGTHYAGPTWESTSGSKVVGAVLERWNADADAIPWLLLRAVSSEGHGVFRGVTYIQRLFTVGGLAPTEPGEVVGEEVRVPYSAWYVFYRAHR